MSLFIVIILFIIFIPVLVTGLSWVIARRLCKPRRHIPKKTPEDLDLPFENVSFRSGKAKLKGWYIPSSYSRPNKDTVILNHGWSSNSSRMLFLAQKFHNAGISVLLFDFRGHGRSDSDGPITMLKFAEDIISGVNYLFKNKLTSEAKVGVFGHSMGASAAILAASMDLRIKALVSCSAFDDPKAVSTIVLRCLKIPKLLIKLNFMFITKWLGKPIESIAPINNINKIEIPILLVHGSIDRIVSPKNLFRLYDQSKKEYSKKWYLQDKDHRKIILDQEFTEGVIEFFRENLISENEINNNTLQINSSNSKYYKYGT